MNWLDCDEIEVVPGKVGGRPVIKGTRIEPDVLVVEAEHGRTPEETQADFPTLRVDTIRAIQAFGAKQHQLVR